MPLSTYYAKSLCVNPGPVKSIGRNVLEARARFWLGDDLFVRPRRRQGLGYCWNTLYGLDYAGFWNLVRGGHALPVIQV